MTNRQTRILQISAILWVIWGLVHMLAGGIVLSSDTVAGFAAISDAVAFNKFSR